jgi:hypothetical protein
MAVRTRAGSRVFRITSTWVASALDRRRESPKYQGQSLDWSAPDWRRGGCGGQHHQFESRGRRHPAHTRAVVFEDLQLSGPTIHYVQQCVNEIAIFVFGFGFDRHPLHYPCLTSGVTPKLETAEFINRPHLDLVEHWDEFIMSWEIRLEQPTQ